jgi:hypothetical protein
MLFVIGNSPKKVELKDLNDCIYYKQQKTYTNVQYDNSVDLKRAIERKALIVLRKSEDNTGSFDSNTAIISTDTKVPESTSFPKIDLLLERIQNLENNLKAQPSAQDNEALLAILGRLERLETNPTAVDLSSIQESLKGIESRMLENKGDGLLDRLEDILNKSGSGVSSREPVSHEVGGNRVEEIYVPNITVEDAKSNIRLEVRTIDTGDSVVDSLKKLKELKSK